MTKPKAPAAKAPGQTDEPPARRGYAARAGDLVGDVGGLAFRKFGFVQASVVARWPEIVGERYARVSSPESIRFPAGKDRGGTLALLVEGAHAPLMQHMAPMIVERVNRFFGYPAVARISWRQGRLHRPAPIERPAPAPIPHELGEGLREIADDGLRASLESLAAQLAGATAHPPIKIQGKIR